MDSPAVSSDSYVIIKNDDSNNAYVLKDKIQHEWGVGGRAIKLPPTRY